MPTNVHSEYAYSEKEYLLAETDEDKLKSLEKEGIITKERKGKRYIWNIK